MLMDKAKKKCMGFYSKHIGCSDIERVIDRCFELDSKMPEYCARRMMLQRKRLVEISEAQEKVTGNSDALKLFFLIVLAENSAKFYHYSDDDGNSKAYVRKFFEEMMPINCSKFLKENLTIAPPKINEPPNLRYAVDFLYAVRCDVAHEGLYYMFHFKDKDSALVVDAGKKTASINLRYEDLVNIIVQTVYVSIKSKLGI